jgi:general secretion pathway protein A
MLEQYYHINEKPFSLLPNPRFLYLSDQYLETKSKLLYFLQDRSASLYLYGSVGNGTTLLRLIAQEATEDKNAIAKYIIAPNLKTANQLLRRICDEFQVKNRRSYEGSLKNLKHI